MENVSDIPLFSSLDRDEGERLGKSCIWKDYDAHELVIDIDEESTDVRFVISGLVRVISRFAIGKEVILGEMDPGQFFGELAAIDGHTRSANITTLYRTKICIMPQKLFLDLVTNNPDINLRVMRVLTKRIRNLNMRLAEQSFLQAKHRLYAELLRLSKPRPGHESQRRISPPPTQKELAERIGSRREVVSRELNCLLREDCFEKTKGALILTNVTELQKRISAAWEE
ncbi:MAG: Crp/Fnr family transcriptional regulator [Pseudomonadota bacterium]